MTLPTVKYSHVVIVLTIAAFALLGFSVWRAWPVISRQVALVKAKVERSKKVSKSRAAAAGKTSGAAVVSRDLLARLKKENASLREENRRLRSRLERTSAAVAEKQAEIEELKLRLLILERTRPARP